MTRARAIVEASLLRIALAGARPLPRRALLALGTLAGTVASALDRRHRRIALDNVRRAFGDDLNDAQARQLVRRCWQHFGRVTVDTLTFPRFTRASAERLVRWEGTEHLRAARARGRGVLLFSAHFGHWELMALMQGYLELPMSIVARPMDNPLVERILARLRSLSGNRIIHKRNALREMARALRAGDTVALLIDQDARDAGVFVPFFGRLASTTPALALLAHRTGAAVMPFFSVPLEDGTYRVVYEPPLDLPRSANRKADVVRWTARCSSIIETWIRRYPEQWLWMHRRWKTRPDHDVEVVEEA